MIRHPLADGWKVILSLVAGPVAIAGLVFFGVTALAFCAGQRDARADAKRAALVDTVRLTDSVRVVVRDTVTIYKRRVDTVKAASDSLDTIVQIVDDSTVQTPDTVAVIPPPVVADLKALRVTVSQQDTLLRWWDRYAVADSNYDRAKDRLHVAEIQQANAPRWGIGVTVGYGCGERGCGKQATVGLSYQGRLPRFSFPWVK